MVGVAVGCLISCLEEAAKGECMNLFCKFQHASSGVPEITDKEDRSYGLVCPFSDWRRRNPSFGAWPNAEGDCNREASFGVESEDAKRIAKIDAEEMADEVHDAHEAIADKNDCNYGLVCPFSDCGLRNVSSGTWPSEDACKNDAKADAKTDAKGAGEGVGGVIGVVSARVAEKSGEKDRQIAWRRRVRLLAAAKVKVSRRFVRFVSFFCHGTHP